MTCVTVSREREAPYSLGMQQWSDSISQVLEQEMLMRDLASPALLPAVYRSDVSKMLTPVGRAALSSATSLLCQFTTSHADDGWGFHSRSVQLHRLV